MSDNTPITDEQYQQALAVVATMERQKQEEIARRRQAVYELVKPIVESDAFISIHEQVSILRDTGPKDDYFFSLSLDAIYNGMTNLGINVTNWVPPVTGPAPVVTPTPAPEGDGDAE